MATSAPKEKGIKTLMPEETAVCAFISHASRTENFIAYVSPALTTCLRAARRTNEVEARVCTLAN